MGLTLILKDGGQVLPTAYLPRLPPTPLRGDYLMGGFYPTPEVGGVALRGGGFTLPSSARY